MLDFLFYLLIIAVVIPLVLVANKPARIFEYPYFMAAVFAVFILPQAYSLIQFPGGVKIGEIGDILLICTLCIVCCFLGYKLTPSFTMVRFISKPADPTRMFHVGLALTLVGIASIVLIPMQQIQFGSRGGMTGIGTIYLFFAGLSFPGFAVFLQLIRQKFTALRLAGLLLSSLSPILSVYTGRREAAVIFFLSIAMTAYFSKRKAPSRIVIFSSLLFATLAIPATGAYRSLVQTGEVRRINRLDIVQNFKNFINQESILELRNAAAILESTRMEGRYGLGAGYWNQIVYRFIPAQIIGKEAKDALLIGATVDRMYVGKLVGRYEIPAGSTRTGMADSYEQFGWLGCLFFAGVGMLFRSIWTAALYPHALFAQLFYIMICTSAMRSVTHQTVDFLPGVFYQLIFLGAAYLYARAPEQRAQPPRGSRYMQRPVRGSQGV
jgi:hypothetical protein